jgi:hypothetical protein
MATLVPLPNPSYQAALAAGVAVGDTVSVTCAIPIFYRLWNVQRDVQITAMTLYNFTVVNVNNQATATLPWSAFYGYYESS